MELTTLLCEIEVCLNSNPLIPLYDILSDCQSLTPAHSLINSSYFIVKEPDVSNAKIPIGKRWQLATQMSIESITSPQKRHKWLKRMSSLRVRDLVVIRDETTAPGKCSMGPRGPREVIRILSTHPAKNGHVKVVTPKAAPSGIQLPVVTNPAEYFRRLINLQRDIIQINFYTAPHFNCYSDSIRPADEGGRNVRNRVVISSITALTIQHRLRSIAHPDTRLAASRYRDRALYTPPLPLARHSAVLHTPALRTHGRISHLNEHSGDADPLYTIARRS